jgi:predicted DsbA family dithiol-disulfide isomerase
MEMRMKLEIFSDYVCPFCWLGELAVKDLKQRLPEIEIIWRAFELRPEPVPLPEAKGEYLTRIWEQSVLPLAQQIGVKMIMPSVKPRSRLAHEVAIWARQQQRFDEMNEALFRAYFERDEDIGQTHTLVTLADTIGLDGGDLKNALEEHRHLGEVLADQQQATQYGLSGVPAFISGNTVLFGVQTADALEEFVRLASHVPDSDSPKTNLPHMPIQLGIRQK